MKLRNFFLGAIAMVVAFSACDDKTEETIGGTPNIELVDLEDDVITFGADGGERQVVLVANRNWTVEENASWIEVAPKSGSAAADQQTVTIKVVKNELDEDDPTAGFDREADLKFTVGAKSVYLTVKQEGPQGSTEALIVYYNNFDKEKAEKGDNGWATYLDSYEGWKNATGTGVETVTYEFDRMTARTNSSNGSAGSHSIYEGSGMNYLWFGSGKPYFAVKDITLPEGKVNFTVSFGTERYLYEAEDNTFNWDEFKAYASIDGVKWTALSWEFAGGELPNGDWDLASATIKVPEGTQKLSLYFAASLASAYAIDDVRVEESLTEGVVVDFAAGEELNPEEGEQGGESDATAIYSNNYDKQEATKTYGSSGSSYPYLDQFDGWRNHAGTGSENVTYSYKGVSVRSNSTSDSSYSDYAGSGLNNIFFGSNAYFSTNNIALNGATTLTLTFGTEKFSYDNGSVFTNSEYHIWLSNDGGAKWVELIDYTFAGGTTEGRWNVATANFTVPSGTETLSICMQVDVASSYRLDDFKLVSGTEAGTTVDFSQAVEKEFGAGSGTVTPPSGEITDVTVEQFNAMPVSTTALYRLTGTVGGPINTQYGNFDLIDATGKVYVYGISNWSEYSSKVTEGVTVTVVGQRGDYNGKIEVLEGYIESLGENGGGNEGGETDVDAIYANDFDKQTSTKSYGSNGNSWPYCNQFDGWKNEKGTGAANVTYDYKSASPRATNSNNNIWLPKTGAYLSVQNIALDGETSFELAFNVICGSPGSYKKSFSSNVFKVHVSADNTKWVELPVTVTANGTDFDSAITTFSVPSGTSTLSITFEKIADETDGYRVDNVALTASETADFSVDFTQGVEKEFGTGGSAGGGSDTPSTGEPTNLVEATVAEFLAASESSDVWYKLTGEITEIVMDKNNPSKYNAYGNLYINDGTDEVYIYGLTNGWVGSNNKSFESIGLKVGDVVTLGTLRGSYNGTPQGGGSNVPAYYISHVAGDSGNEDPETPVDPSEVQTVTVAEFNAKPVSTSVLYRLTGTVGGPINTTYGNFDIIDETGKVYVYGISNWSEYSATFAEGGTVTVVGQRGDYNGKIEVLEGYIESYTAPTGGGDDSGETPEAPETPGTPDTPEAGTYTLDFSDVANRTSYSTSEQVWEQNGIKLTNNKASSTSNVGDYTNPARFYKSTSLKIEKTGMKKLVFLCDTYKSSYPTDLQNSVTDSNATVTIDGLAVTITLASAVDVFEIATMASQVRVDLLTVYAE